MAIIPHPKPAKHHKGYFKIRAVNHEIADGSGYVPLHRMILFNKLGGGGGSKCHWCGYPLKWKSDQNPKFKYVINADHLDGDNSNNLPGNIVPSCSWCNYNRSWIILTEFMRLIELFKCVAPWNRPMIIPYCRRLKNVNTNTIQSQFCYIGREL